MIAIIDYGVGNLFSLESSFSAIGERCTVTSSPDEIKNADKIILPGVGAFADAMEKLRKTELIPTIKREISDGKPLLGICLGMQLLFSKSYEYGEHDGGTTQFHEVLEGLIVQLQGERNAFKQLSLPCRCKNTELFRQLLCFCQGG